MKMFLTTLGLLTTILAAIWAVGFFALGYGLQDVGAGLASLGKSVLLSPVAAWRWFASNAGIGMAGGGIAALLIAGWLGTIRSPALGMLGTGAALVLFYPAFAFADAPLAGETWRMIGLYFGGWLVALVVLAVLFAGLSFYNDRVGR